MERKINHKRREFAGPNVKIFLLLVHYSPESLVHILNRLRSYASNMVANTASTSVTAAYS